MPHFRPPVVPSRGRFALAVLVATVAAIPLVLLGGLVLGGYRAEYVVDRDSLLVHTGDPIFGDRRVRLDDIVEVRAIEIRRATRVGGTAFPGFCAGRFDVEGVGTVYASSDCGERALLVRTRGDELPLLLSPPDPPAFLEAVTSHRAYSVALPRANKGPIVFLLGLIGLLAALTAAGVVALAFRGPASMRYVVGDGALEVRTLFGRKRWPLAGMRARTYQPGRLLRFGGVAMPGYFTGLYREAGANVRVYATELADGVLLEGGSRIFVSPAQRERFLDALRREGAIVDDLDAPRASRSDASP